MILEVFIHIKICTIELFYAILIQNPNLCLELNNRIQEKKSSKSKKTKLSWENVVAYIYK